ncbi:MAG: carboxylating nicotinate-nucleotide diphosphorylase [Persephonella sp.]|nr:MAG: carboxylating nicotinate-nucleotide diphosphorylase [Persephonella sp.]RUM61600.1 MAG: carboxylating nicotinate-nucleotide diphosphorylase [Persephonella sp.]
MDNIFLEQKLKKFLLEDIGIKDITTDNLDIDRKVKGYFVAKDNGILAGIEFAIKIFKILDKDLEIISFKPDGSKIEKGEIILEILGSGKALLKGERTALNIVQRLSGIATLTNKYVRQLEGTKTKLLDTRKTTPSFRYFEKYAVKVGGGHNHRFALYDMVMIKDNHIKFVGSIKEAVRQIKSKVSPMVKIEVEVSNIDELMEALDTEVDIIMLDNMTLEEMEKAVKIVNGKVKLEASGNITLDNIKDVALTGVDYISTGATIHSSKWLDISMRIDII